MYPSLEDLVFIAATTAPKLTQSADTENYFVYNAVINDAVAKVKIAETAIASGKPNEFKPGDGQFRNNSVFDKISMDSDGLVIYATFNSENIVVTDSVGLQTVSSSKIQIGDCVLSVANDVICWMVDDAGRIQKAALMNVPSNSEAYVTYVTEDDVVKRIYIQYFDDMPNLNEMGSDSDKKAYIIRAYDSILNRVASVNEVTHWTSKLESGSSAGEIIKEFFRSEEYKARGMTNEQTVILCYETMLGRAPFSDEIANWAAMLQDGYSATRLVAEFVASKEFQQTCAAYGLTAGTIELDPRDQNSNITRFVRRCYTYALGREADEGGLNEWCEHLLTQDLTPERVAFGFVFSDEANGRDMDRAEFMTMLYQMMMDRTPDEAGLENWVGALESYETAYGEDQGRQEVYKLFAASAEFGLMLQNFGF